MQSVEEKVGAEYVRNPDYWKPGLPYLDGIRTRDFPTTQRLVGVSARSGRRRAGPGLWKPRTYLAGRGRASSRNGIQTTILHVHGSRIPRPNRWTIASNPCTPTARSISEIITAWAESARGGGRMDSAFPTALVDWDLTEDEYRNHLEWKQPKDEAAKEALSLLGAAGFTKDKPAQIRGHRSDQRHRHSGTQLLQAQWKRLEPGRRRCRRLASIRSQCNDRCSCEPRLSTMASPAIRRAWSTPTSGSGRPIEPAAASTSSASATRNWTP